MLTFTKGSHETRDILTPMVKNFRNLRSAVLLDNQT